MGGDQSKAHVRCVVCNTYRNTKCVLVCDSAGMDNEQTHIYTCLEDTRIFMKQCQLKCPGVQLT